MKGSPYIPRQLLHFFYGLENGQLLCKQLMQPVKNRVLSEMYIFLFLIKISRKSGRFLESKKS